MITMDALMAALPDILAAPKDESRVRQLTFRPKPNQREHPKSLRFTRDEGVPNERWRKAPWLKLPDGSPDPDIQVSILPARVHDLVRPDPEASVHPGDTIIADLDTSEANLPEGTLLRVGTSLLRVSNVFNDGCVKWKVRYGKDAKDWIVREGHPPLRLRGILCAIVEDGEVHEGDVIRVEKRPN